jgi:hypothetical protein
MAVGSRYFKVAVAANTNVQVRAAGQTKTSSYRMVFVSSGTDATEVRVADSSATLTAGDGFPLLIAKSQAATGTEDLDLVPNEELWVRSNQAGDLYVRDT